MLNPQLLSHILLWYSSFEMFVFVVDSHSDMSNTIDITKSYNNF